MKKKIYYWSPFLSQIATCKAVINSAASLVKFGKDYESSILNFFGEFNSFNKDIINKNVKLLNFYRFNFQKYLPYRGLLKSRFSFLFFFILGFYPLKKIIKKDNPDYLIIHLITSLPLTLLFLNNFNTKFILRISGFPKMNFLRRIFWKITLKKIHLITCPTKNTVEYMKSLNLVESSKIKLLYDPVIIIEELNEKKNEHIDLKDYYLSVGRLTKQKNFLFLCKAFKKIIENNKDIKLVIAGEGEEKNKILSYINKNNLNKNILLLGYVKNIYPYFVNSKGFILSSLWEDPGFVLVEASFCKTPVLSSNAWPGPVELIKDKYNGILFENDNIESLVSRFEIFKNFDKNSLKINNLKESKKFTQFNHYLKLNKLLSIFY